MKAIIGTGQLGLAVMDALLSSNPNEEILLVNRTGKLQRLLPANVQLMAADATNKHEVEFICRDAEVVFSCTDVPYQSWSAFYPAISSALAYALNKTDARLVFADNMYSYGNVSGIPMTELLPHSAKTKKGKVRAAAIQTLLYSGEPFNSRVAIVKAADFIGPRIHKGIFGTDFLDKLHNGKTINLFGDPELAHTFTYILDFACAMVNIGNAPDAFGQIWHAPNATAISPRTWIKLFEQQSGKTARIMHTPKALVKIVGLFNTLARELYELAYQFEQPYLADHKKYATRFGNHFTDHETIVIETIAWHTSGKQQ